MSKVGSGSHVVKSPIVPPGDESSCSGWITLYHNCFCGYLAMAQAIRVPNDPQEWSYLVGNHLFGVSIILSHTHFLEKPWVFGRWNNLAILFFENSHEFSHHEFSHKIWPNSHAFSINIVQSPPFSTGAPQKKPGAGRLQYGLACHAPDLRPGRMGRGWCFP